MTTTAHEDQFTIGTQTIEPVRQPYNTVSILRRNIADMEVALRTQTELKEKAEAELAKLAQQKPVAWSVCRQLFRDSGPAILFASIKHEKVQQLYAAPVPAPHTGATHCYDCGLTWLDDGLNPLRCPYCKKHASERNARRYLALREYGVKVDIKGRWLSERYLDAAADRLLGGGE